MGLAAKVTELLAGGPAGPERIAREALGLSGDLRATTAAVRALLEPDERFDLVDGRWRLREPEYHAGDGLGALRYAVVDVETTGGSPRRGHRVTEIAVVEVERGRVTDDFRTLVNPGRPIPRGITRITGITDEMVAGAPPFRAVAGEVRERLRDRVFVAHNVGFDWRFVRSELAGAPGTVPEPPRLCTVQLTRRLVPELDRRNLDTVARFFDVEIDGRHRALGDAAATARILSILLERARERGIRTWRELEALLGRRTAPGDGPGAGGAGAREGGSGTGRSAPRRYGGGSGASERRRGPADAGDAEGASREDRR